MRYATICRVGQDGIGGEEVWDCGLTPYKKNVYNVQVLEQAQSYGIKNIIVRVILRSLVCAVFLPGIREPLYINRPTFQIP